MAVAVDLEFDGGTLEQYDEVARLMDYEPGGAAPPCCLFHWGALTDRGLRVTDVWETKDGWRRVRRDPPTIDDAVVAAQGLAEDLEGQIEIDVALMSVSADEARTAVLKMRRADTRLTIPARGGSARAVVVERKSPRRQTVAARASVGRRGLG